MTSCTRCEQVEVVRDLYRATPTRSLPEWIWDPEDQLQFDLAFAVLSERFSQAVIKPLCREGYLDSWSNPQACRSVLRRWTSRRWN